MENRKGALNVKSTAFGGILLALSAVTLFLASVLPTGRLALYALSSFYVAVFIMKYGIRAGWVFYAASCLLAFVTMRGDIPALALYIVFFGLYGIVKYYIERINHIAIEYVLKLIFYNIVLFIGVVFIGNYLLGFFRVEFPWWILIAISEIVFLIYDYVFSMLIHYYKQKLKKILGI